MNPVRHISMTLLLVFVLLLAGCAAVPAAPAGEVAPAEQGEAADEAQRATDEQMLNVVSTVSPVTNLIYNIGGDRIRLVGIVPEGVNSHTFEPAPSDARLLAEADIIFINGLALEEPTLRLAEANKADDAEIVLLGDLTIEPSRYIYDFSFPEEDGKPNPHLWPNPFLALRYAEIVRDKLSELDAANADYYSANYAALEERINALDEAIRATIATIPEENRKLLTYHDSWAYFAPDYGMTVIGAMQPADFSEPSAREVADLILQLREQQLPAVFGSEVFPSSVLEQIAAEAGTVFVDTLSDDDLPGAPGDDNHSYIGMMVANLQTMAEALGGDPSVIADFDTSNIPGSDDAVEQAQE